MTMAMKFKKFERNPGNVAFCYYRYSSDAQRDVSIEQQRKAAHEYALKHGYVIPADGEFEDHAKTGTNLDRAGIQNMIHQCKIRRPAYLLVWKMDRISREIHDSFWIDGKMRDYGVEIVTVSETLPEDEGMRYAVQGLYAAMAHNYIIDLSQNVTRGLADNAKQCLYNGRKILGYKGKSQQKYEIDERNAVVVKRIFNDYVNGKSLKVIANELDLEGFKSSTGRPFVVSTLANILRNRAYVGEYHWRSLPEPIKGGMPRIVTDELFEAAQKKLDENKRGGKGAIKKNNPDAPIADYWLSGHVYCGECGETMQGTCGTGRHGDIHYYYSCKNARKHKCTMKNKRKKEVESIVKYEIDNLLNDASLRILIANKCFNYYNSKNGFTEDLIKSKEASLKEVNKQLKRLISFIKRGNLFDSIVSEIEELEKQKKSLEESIAVDKNRQKNGLKFDDVVRYFESWAGKLNRDGVYYKNALSDLIDRIYLYKDKVVITFYYTDDRRTLPFEDTINIIDNLDYLVMRLKNNGDFTNEVEMDYEKYLEPENNDFFL